MNEREIQLKSNKMEAHSPVCCGEADQLSGEKEKRRKREEGIDHKTKQMSSLGYLFKLSAKESDSENEKQSTKGRFPCGNIDSNFGYFADVMSLVCMCGEALTSQSHLLHLPSQQLASYR